MSFLSTRRHRIAAAFTVAALAAGGGSAAIVIATSPASASTGAVSLSAATQAMPTAAAIEATPTAAATAAASTPAARRHHRRQLLARADHASLELKVKGHWVTYVLDRGKVTSVSGTAISLARPDGQSVTLTIDPATRFGRTGSAAAIKTGAEATVISDHGAALRVAQPVRPSVTAPPSPATAPSTAATTA
jgi:hypothetical protein